MVEHSASDPRSSGDIAGRVEAVAECLYNAILPTWEDQWPLWQYADEQQAEWMRTLAREVLSIPSAPRAD